MTRTTLTILLLALAGSGHAAEKAHKTPAKPAARACVPGEPAFWKDQGLTAKLASKLQFHKPLLREKIEVKVTGGAAILSGHMSTQALIDEAVRTAVAVDGIKCVQNYLAVGAPIAAPGGNPTY